MIVTDVQQLIDRSAKFDEELDALYSHLLTGHPGIPDLCPVVIDKTAVGDKCSTCGCVQITSWSLGESKPVPACKDCVVCLKLQGAKHALGSDDVCLDCTITRDVYGYPRQIYHQTKRRGPEYADDGTTVLHEGLDADITAGVVEVDDVSGVVSVRGSIWKAKRKEPTRSWRRFFPHDGIAVGADTITPDMVGTFV